MGAEASREAWAVVARDVLIASARRYRSVVTYKELAVEVQARTGIRTKQLTHYWIGDVLARVSADSTRRGEPLLSSLCVNAQGSVGPGYAPAVQAAYGRAPADADDHAAQERLACHRHFEAPDLPSSGGVAALTHQVATARARPVRRPVPEPREAPTCPTCHMQMPATGICDTCG